MSDKTFRGSMKVNRENCVGRVSPRLYGGLIELIGETIAGGLSAELIRNRKFVDVTDYFGEGTPRHWEPLLPRTQREPVHYIASYNGPASGTRSLCMFAPGRESQERAVRQSHLDIRAETPYSLTFYVRSLPEPAKEVEVSLADKAGSESYEPVSIGPPDSRGWRKLTYRIFFPRCTDHGELRIRVVGSGCHYLGAVSMLPEDNIHGFRADVVNQLKALGLKLLRFPGGCAAEAYDWRAGVGPRDYRPPWVNAAWCNLDDMDIGTDEICRLAEHLGAEVHLTVNISTLPEDVAAQWVEYCNGSLDTPGGELRAVNGHPEPYGVRLWGLGNEANSWGFPCEHSPEEYVALCKRFMGAMRRVDPDIEFVAVSNDPSGNATYSDWDTALFRDIPGGYDHHAVHLYTFMPVPREFPSLGVDPNDMALACVATPHYIESELRRIRAIIEEGIPEPARRPLLYLEEWGLLAAHRDWETDPTALPDGYNLRGALCVAGMFNSLLRQCDVVGACNIVYPTSSEFVFRDGNQVHVLPSAIAMGLHQRFAGTHSYLPQIDSPTYAHPALGSLPAQSGVPYLDAAATTNDERNELILTVVNRHPDHAATVDISLTGFSLKGTARAFQLAEVSGFGDISDWYDKPSRDGVGQRDRMTVPTVWCSPKVRGLPRALVEELEPFEAAGEMCRTFPAHSFTVIVIDMTL